jgi:4-hydroxybenzoate polyprenyltransferase/phosphoglycolate phosphatase-like HAD superfamily hydrolase
MIDEPAEKMILIVDLDGSLVSTDTLWESVVTFLKTNPLRIIPLILWLFRGKAGFKAELTSRALPDFSTLPYHQAVLEHLHRARRNGREVLLASAANRKIVEKVARHLGIFSDVDVIASEENQNLSGKRKLQAIRSRIGDRSFEYIGDSKADLPLWEAAASAVLVDPSRTLLRKTNHLSEVKVIRPAAPVRPFRAWLRAMRVPQWTKSLFLFVPPILAHRIFESEIVITLVYAFFALSLSASAIYILNDLVDLEADRVHPTKKHRPFAAGILPIPMGLAIFPLLIGASLSIAAVALPQAFILALGFYLVLTISYTFYLKRLPIFDVIILSGLYTLRILLGAVAVSVPVTSWLLTFSMFVFMSLALLKRYLDIRLLENEHLRAVEGRGYLGGDLDIVSSAGITSGYLSLLVLALYINSESVKALYTQPAILWLAIPVIFYWITRMWLLAHRGNMTEDPINFAIKDPQSYLIGAALIVIMASATYFDLLPLTRLLSQ